MEQNESELRNIDFNLCLFQNENLLFLILAIYLQLTYSPSPATTF